MVNVPIIAALAVHSFFGAVGNGLAPEIDFPCRDHELTCLDWPWTVSADKKIQGARGGVLHVCEIDDF